jgi:hypothetical protein
MTNTTKPNVEWGLCGSWLACDSDVEFTTVIAGKPAPTFDRVSNQTCR